MLGQLGHRGDGDVELAVHLLGQFADRVGEQLVGAERGGEVGVHLGGGDAEPVGLPGEVAARVGARQADGRLPLSARAGRPGRELRPWAYRSRTLVAASVQPSVASRRYLDMIARLVGAPSSLVSIQPAARPPAASRAGQGGGHLQVRVGTGAEPAEHLEDGLLAEHQAGVALLGPDHEVVEAVVKLASGSACMRTVAELRALAVIRGEVLAGEIAVTASAS